MSLRRVPPLVVLIVVFLLPAVACTFGGDSSSAADDLPTTLNHRISQATDSYYQAEDLWERLVDGDLVSCQEQMAIPTAFALTESQAAENPQSVLVRDYLNSAITKLEQIESLWQFECTQPREAVPLNILRQMKMLLNETQSDLRSADEAYRAWQA